MEIIQVCPVCGSVGVEVESKTVKCMLRTDLVLTRGEIVDAVKNGCKTID